MLKTWRRYLHYSVYRKMLISYVLLIATTVCIISIFLFSLYSKNMTDEIVRTSTSMLSQTSYTSDLIYERVISAGSNLILNNKIINVMYCREPNRLLEFHVIQHFFQLQSNYPYIKYISVYNSTLDRYVGTRGISPRINDELIDYIRQNNGFQYMEFFPRKIEIPYIDNARAFADVLSFVLYPRYGSTRPAEGALIIDIDEGYIRNLMNSMQNENDNIFIVDEKGIVLSHTNQEHFLSDFSNLSYIKQILNSSDNEGYFTTDIDSRKHLVVYVKSQTLNWFFVNIRPYDQMFLNTSRLQNITLAISFVLILAGALIAFWLSQSIYNPLGRLVNRIITTYSTDAPLQRQDEVALLADTLERYRQRGNLLEQYKVRFFPLLQETHLRCLLKGNGSHLEFEQAKQLIEPLASYLTGPYYTVLYLEIDNYNKFIQKHSPKDQELYSFALCNVLLESLNRFTKSDVACIEGKAIALLLQHKDENIISDIHIALNEVLNVFIKQFQFTFSTGIGDTVTDRDAIHRSYASAQENVKYRLFYGHSSIISSDMLKVRERQDDTYPSSAEKKIINAIRLNNEEDLSKGIMQFRRQMEKTNCYNAVMYSHLLILSIFKEFDHLEGIDSDDFKGYYEYFKEVQNLETFNEIMEAVESLCLKICSRLEELKQRKNAHLIQQIQKYIHNNYSDPCLSVDKAAELVQLSSGYVLKLFRSITQYNFNDYVNKVRLEKAQELLLSTDIPINTISDMVGIKNTTYFYTLFKKSLGMTPAQFRSIKVQENGLHLTVSE